MSQEARPLGAIPPPPLPQAGLSFAQFLEEVPAITWLIFLTALCPC